MFLLIDLRHVMIAPEAEIRISWNFRLVTEIFKSRATQKPCGLAKIMIDYFLIYS